VTGNSAHWTLHDFDLIFTGLDTPAVLALPKKPIHSLILCGTLVNFTFDESLLHYIHYWSDEETKV
jgi:hypothetical protein